MTEVLLERPIATNRLNELAKKEKLGNGKPPINELHYYWTRKPLITSRTVLLASLSDGLDDDELQQLSGINSNPTGKPLFYRKPWKGPYIQQVQLYKNVMARARELYGEDLTVFDPFAGSGMIGFEALRLGLNVVLSDYNPVAFLIMKATMEYPKKYGEKLCDDVKREAERISEELKAELSSLYPKHDGKEVVAYIWAWEVRCRSCGGLTPLVGAWHLSKEEYLAYRLVNGGLEFSIAKGEAPEGNVDRGNGTCLLCNMPIPHEEVMEDIRQNQRERLLAVVLQDRTYDLPTDEDLEAYAKAKELLSNSKELEPFIPDEMIPPEGNVVRASKYLPLWRDLFNPRQLLLLSTMAKKIREATDRISSEDGVEYAEAVGAYLSCWLAKHVDYNSRTCHWIYNNTVIGESMANRGLSMSWIHTEVNPSVKFSGSLQGMLHDVLDALRFSVQELRDSGRADISLKSALQYDAGRKFKLIVTDPPYADDVPYPELSEFFYVWHKRTIGHLLGDSFTPTHVDTAEEIDQGGGRTKEDFYDRFDFAVRKLYDLLDDDGLLVLFYAHRSSDVWEKVVNSFAGAGFHITNAVPLSTESENNVIAQGKRNIYYSLIMTARKRRPDAGSADLQSVREEIRSEIAGNIDRVGRLNYSQGELFLWGMGIALKHFTAYSRIESFSKEDMAKTALESAQDAFASVFVDAEIRKYAGKSIPIDRDTLFYIFTLKGGDRELDTDAFNQSLKIGLDEKSLFDKKLVVKKRDGKKTRIYLNDAFSRSKEMEVEGKDSIRGNAVIDYIHRALVSYAISPGLDKVDENAQNAGMLAEDFVGLIRTIAGIERESDALKDERECKVANDVVRAYDEVRGSTAR